MEPINPVNPYAPPQAALEVAPAVARTASLENAVEGRYDFTIGDVMDEAWELTKGTTGVLYRKIFFAAAPPPDMPAPYVTPAGPPPV
jgi:hypothetical protein